MDYDNIIEEMIKSTRNIDKILEAFSNIDGNTLCIGSGGSKVVATFLASVLNAKNNIITKVIDVSSIESILRLYDNIIVCSYSGKNYGVKYALDKNKKKYLFSSRKSKINDENLLSYDVIDEKSFISLKTTLIPMAILLKYYLGDNFEDCLKDMFRKIDEDDYIDISGYVNIFADDYSMSAVTFLESSFIEAGLSIPIIHYKYDYCHGRSTINKSHDNSAIIFSKNSDLDDTLTEVVNITMKNSKVISSPYEDAILSDFYFTLVSFYLLLNIAKNKGVNLNKIDYDKIAVKKLYYFKGSMDNASY